MNIDFTSYLEKIEQTILTYIPACFSEEWKLASFGIQSAAVKDSHIEPLAAPARELVSLGGKRWRPLLMVLCAQAAADANGFDKETAEKRAYSLTPLVEFVHTASLIHDDIEDSSDTRRGKPAAYITYGTDTAINAGSWLYFEAPVCIDRLDCSAELKNTLYSAYAMELRRLHLGQAMDIAWHRDNTAEPSAQEYIAMVKNKTGTLASLAARTGTLCAGTKPQDADKASLAAAQIGAGFQIIDDVINLTTGNPGKKRGDDIVEGKKSLPVLLLAEQCPQQMKKLHTLFKQARSGGIESPAVEEAISVLTDSGTILQARNRGIKLIQDACEKFDALFGSNNEGSAKIRQLFMSMIPQIQLGEAKNA